MTSAEAIKELQEGKAPPLIETDRSGHVVSMVAPPGSTIRTPANGVDGFVRRYSGAFGLTSAYAAKRTASAELPGGDRVTRYQQVADGVPVIGGQIVVTTDARGRVRGAAAEATAAVPRSTTAGVSEAAAGEAAVRATADQFGFDATMLRPAKASLWLYDPALIGAPGAKGVRPVWWVDVTADDGLVSTVLIDATNGSPALVGKAKKEARDRIVCDLANAKVNFDSPGTYNCTPTSTLGQKTTTRVEGGPASTVAEVNRAFTNLGVTHDFFRTNYRVDSFDGRGAKLRATVRACYIDSQLCPWPNAFWDGSQFVFGSGFAVDDVVGHEYTHAVIDHASELVYWYQSGAINESLADIFGEFIDQSYVEPGEDSTKLWLIGEGLPGGEIRDMADPGRLGQPEVFYGPQYYEGDLDNGGVHRNSGVGNHLAYLIANGGTDQWTTFPGIGIAKSKVLWYRTMLVLPSAADYPTLGLQLTRSCVELIGHYGITRDDCFRTVWHARAASGLNQSESLLGCEGGATPDEPAFRDDFETRDRWTMSSPNWQYIPSSSIPISYAASGKGALYGYTPTTGPTIYATTANPIVIPSDTENYGPYLSYKLLPYPIGYFQTTSGPMWQYDDLADGAGNWINLGAPWDVRGGDYTEYSQSVGALAGKTVKLRIRISPTDSVREWLFDDVTITSCTYTHERPYDISAVWSGTTAELTWRYNSTLNDHIELAYDPPIPGAPTYLSGLGINQSEVLRSVMLTGLDPAVAYRVTITLVSTSPGAWPPRPVNFRLAADPTLVCLTNAPLRAYWSPIRTKPVVDPCRIIQLPQKPGDD